MTEEGARPRGPLDMLAVLGQTEGRLDEHSRLIEMYTFEGLLSVWWFGAPDATDVVLMVGGAAGGVLGPGRSLHLELGRRMAADGRGAMAVDYRRPGDIDRCLLDTTAAADLAVRNGAERFCLLGHSFGGAVAIQAAIAMAGHAAGVITYATQSAGCEGASHLGDVPLLLVHGERDSILGPENSRMVQMIAGHGDVRTYPGADHLLAEVADELFELSYDRVTENFERHAAV